MSAQVISDNIVNAYLETCSSGVGQPSCEHSTLICAYHKQWRTPYYTETYGQREEYFNRCIEYPTSKLLNNNKVAKASRLFFEATFYSGHQISNYIETPFTMKFLPNNMVQLNVESQDDGCIRCGEVFVLNIENLEEFVKRPVYYLDIEVAEDGIESFKNFTSLMSHQFFGNVLTSSFVFRGSFPSEAVKRVVGKCPKMGNVRAWHASNQEVNIAHLFSKIQRIENLELHYGGTGLGYQIDMEFSDLLIRLDKNQRAIDGTSRNIVAPRARYMFSNNFVTVCVPPKQYNHDSSTLLQPVPFFYPVPMNAWTAPEMKTFLN